MIRQCAGCSEMINPKRLEILPKTQFCVKCSDSGRKKAFTLQIGEGDHSYTDIVI
jgi:RNA polymerase-binding transcription factor DksA